MNIKDMIAFTRACRGHMSETVRSAVAWGICSMVERGLQDAQSLAWWNGSGHLNFLADCDVTVDPCTTPDEIAAEPTALAGFINKWRAVKMYKDTEGEWKELPQEMHALIHTMMEDLEDLAAEMPDVQ